MPADRQLETLFVGINYAPEHTGIAPYTTAAADHLAARGHTVTVMSGMPHYPSWSVPAEFRGQLSQIDFVGAVKVDRLRHFVPRRQDALQRGLYELTFAAQVAARRLVRSPDVVVAVVPTLLSAAVAAQIAARHEARLVVWVQDLMSAAATESGIQGGARVAGLVSRIERSVLRRARSVVVVSDRFRAPAVRAGAKPEDVVTIPNWTRTQASTKDRQLTRSERGWGSDEIVVLHTGNMGLKQDLGRVVASAKLALEEHPHVTFVLMGDGSQRRDLEASSRGVDNLWLVDSVAELEYGNVLAAADVLLINERAGLAEMSLPSKLTSYLASGSPVIAAVDPSGCTAAEIRRSGGGIIASTQTPRAILDEVLALSAQPQLAKNLAADGRSYAEAHLSAGGSLSRFAALVEESARVDDAVPVGR